MKIRNSILLFVFFLVVDAAQAQVTVLDGVYIKEHTPGRKPITYGSGGPYGSSLIREANMMWSKRVWRRIDMREKINHPLYYPEDPIQDRKSLFDVLKEAILVEGTITAYDPGPLNDDDEFTLALTPDEVKKKLFWVDTVWVTDIETDEMVPELQEQSVKTELIQQYEIKEDWFFDNERSVMDVRIIGICPMQKKIDELTGEFRGFEPLFWVYFPEARHVLANAEVYNIHNDAERRTYDDIFWKRQFGSFIVKESNVYDRVIIEYKTGLDALIEAEKIKDDMFMIEHDLWHF